MLLVLPVLVLTACGGGALSVPLPTQLLPLLLAEPAPDFAPRQATVDKAMSVRPHVVAPVLLPG